MLAPPDMLAPRDDACRDSLDLGFAADLAQPTERFKPNTLELGAAWGALGAALGITPFGTAYLVEHSSQLGLAARMTGELTLMTLLVGAGVGVIVAASRSWESRRGTLQSALWRVVRRALFTGGLLAWLGAMAGAAAAQRFAGHALPMRPAPLVIAGALALGALSCCFCIRAAQEHGAPRPRAAGLRAALTPTPALLALALLLIWLSAPMLRELERAWGTAWAGALVGLAVAALTSVWLSVSLELTAARARGAGRRSGPAPAA